MQETLPRWLGTPLQANVYYALAKIGAWYDSKINGRVGIKTLWLSWFTLMEMVESAVIFKSVQQASDL